VIGLIRSGQLDATASVSAPHKPGWNPITGEPTFSAHLRPMSQPPVHAPFAGPAPYGNVAPAPYGAPAPAPYGAPAPAPYGAPAPAPYGAPAPAPHSGIARARQISNGQGMRIAAWILLGIAGFFLLVTPLMALDDNAKPNAWSGGVTVVIMFGLPGALLMWRGRKAAAKALLVGFLTSRDRISVTEVARMIKKPELATEQLLAQLNQEFQMDLVYVPDERQYVHRSRLSTTHAIPEKCPTCGAPTHSQLVVQGERVMCKYCDAPVA